MGAALTVAEVRVELNCKTRSAGSRWSMCLCMNKALRMGCLQRS